MHDIDMGSFLSSLSGPPRPQDNFDLTEMEPLSRLSGPRSRQIQYSGRHYPLNPNGHFTTNLLTGFRRRLRTDTSTQTHQQEWVLEPPLISADHGPNVPNVPEHKAGAETSDGSQSGDEVNIKAWSVVIVTDYCTVSYRSASQFQARQSHCFQH